MQSIHNVVDPCLLRHTYSSLQLERSVDNLNSSPKMSSKAMNKRSSSFPKIFLFPMLIFLLFRLEMRSLSIFKRNFRQKFSTPRGLTFSTTGYVMSLCLPTMRLNLILNANLIILGVMRRSHVEVECVQQGISWILRSFGLLFRPTVVWRLLTMSIMWESPSIGFFFEECTILSPFFLSGLATL